MRDEIEVLLTVKELAAVLKLTEQTIQRYVLRKEIPFHKIMRAVRFRPSEINCWIDNGGLIANEELGMRNEELGNEQLTMNDEQVPTGLAITVSNEQGAMSNEELGIRNEE
jgi:excisionase family DNA binding protein